MARLRTSASVEHASFGFAPATPARFRSYHSERSAPPCRAWVASLTKAGPAKMALHPCLSIFFSSKGFSLIPALANSACTSFSCQGAASCSTRLLCRCSAKSWYTSVSSNRFSTLSPVKSSKAFESGLPRASIEARLAATRSAMICATIDGALGTSISKSSNVQMICTSPELKSSLVNSPAEPSSLMSFLKLSTDLFFPSSRSVSQYLRTMPSLAFFCLSSLMHSATSL
mmetsp:Transcript_5842/g.17588  ORF Transcript_5842/g.17588 Transcript_5842/m.17588 type:complete len:229 (-) Transcript_5842:1571-2257(-)